MPTTQPITLPWCLILHLYNTWGLTPNQFGILLIVGIVLIAVCAYLLGSISPSIILSRRVLHDDVRRHGSGNAGTTNMLRNYGAKFAVLTLFLDILKTAIAMGIGYLIYQKDGAALAGLFYLLKAPSVSSTMGAMPGIKAFTAAVIGGIGSIPGAMLGGILLGIVEAVSYKITAIAPYTDAIEFSILILILLVRPTGFLGKKRREKV
jgi:glycerol-3-phosphate acyltransferase PlsY